MKTTPVDFLKIVSEPGAYDKSYRGKLYTMNREGGQSPSGVLFNDRWVLRLLDGTYVEHHRYRHELASWHDLELEISP